MLVLGIGNHRVLLDGQIYDGLVEVVPLSVLRVLQP